MRRRRKGQEFERTIDANQIVGANFRLARELRGWTQEEAARRLEPYLGQLLPKASISAIERVLERDRRRVFNAQELVAFAAAFDVPIWWFFMPIRGSERMKLEGVGYAATELLVLLLGRQDQLELLQSEVANLRRGTDRSAIEAVLEEVFGSPSWRHFEASRLLALQELAFREASTIETLVGALREVVEKFDGVFERSVPQDVEQAAFMEWLPSQVYRRTSEVLVGKELFHKVFNWERPSLPRVQLVLDRLDLPLEDWIDTDDPELMERAGAFFERLEEQLADKEIPAPPAEPAEAI